MIQNIVYGPVKQENVQLLQGGKNINSGLCDAIYFFKEQRLRFIGDDVTVGLSCGDQAVTDLQDKQGQARRLVIVSPALRRAG